MDESISVQTATYCVLKDDDEEEEKVKEDEDGKDWTSY